MGWARLDDGWHDHPKVVAAGIEAAGLWAMCLTWAHKQRRISKNPGVVPHEVMVRFAQSPTKARKISARLHEVGLLDPLTDAGWPIHDFASYLPRTPDPEQAAEHGRRGGRPRKGKGSEVSSERVDPFDEKGLTLSSEKGSPRTRVDAGASTGASPNPYPKRKNEDQETSATSSPRGGVESTDRPTTAQTLVAEWIDHCDHEVPKRLRGQVAKRLGDLLAEGIDPKQVRGGLAIWHSRGLASPTAIDSCVYEAGRTTPVTPPRIGLNGQGPPGSKPSTTDQRVRDNLAVADRFAPAGTPPSTLLALGGTTP